MRRGEIWWAKLPLPAGRRPVVLISRDSAYAVRSNITVAEISTNERGIPSEIVLTKRDGLPRRCVANLDNLVTIPKTWLEARVVQLAPARLAALDTALRFSLGLS